MTSTDRPARSASVVIPAYNEGRVLRRCLDALRGVDGLDLEIVVAANGCTDDTVEIARSVPGVTVLEVPVASKAAALNAGDAAATTFPRIFLDADIVLGPGALSALVEALDVPAPLIAAPEVRFVTTGCSPAVRLFYSAYEETPYIRSGLVGLGVYGMSEAGRARFGAFPDLQADDLFVQCLFAPAERVTTAGHFDVQAPRDLANLLRVRTRIARGNVALAQDSPALPSGAPEGLGQDDRAGDSVAAPDFSASTGSTLSALARAARSRPALVPAVATYVGVVTAARFRARRENASTWHRDESTR